MIADHPVLWSVILALLYVGVITAIALIIGLILYLVPDKYDDVTMWLILLVFGIEFVWRSYHHLRDSEKEAAINTIDFLALMRLATLKMDNAKTDVEEARWSDVAMACHHILNDLRIQSIKVDEFGNEVED